MVMNIWEKQKKQTKKSIKNAKKPSLRVQLNFLTVSTLKGILRYNDQSGFGNKPDLISRITYMFKNGTYPRCPQCHGGRVKPRPYRRKNQSKYYCPGYPCAFRGPFGYHDCNYETDDCKREKIRFPPLLNIKIDWINN